MQPRVSKQILENVIKHVDTHNRIIEEDECWRQHHKAKASKQRLSPQTIKYEQNAIKQIGNKPNSINVHRNHNNSFGKAYMDDEESIHRKIYIGREDTTGSWTRQFDIIESSMKDRWGHSGFKELYPELFESPKSLNNVKRKYSCSEDSIDSHHSPIKKKKKRKSARHKRSLDTNENFLNDDAEKYPKRHKKHKRENSVSSDIQFKKHRRRNESINREKTIHRLKKHKHTNDDDDDDKYLKTQNTNDQYDRPPLLQASKSNNNSLSLLTRHEKEIIFDDTLKDENKEKKSRSKRRKKRKH